MASALTLLIYLLIIAIWAGYGNMDLLIAIGLCIAQLAYNESQRLDGDSNREALMCKVISESEYWE